MKRKNIDFIIVTYNSSDDVNLCSQRYFLISCHPTEIVREAGQLLPHNIVHGQADRCSAEH